MNPTARTLALIALLSGLATAVVIHFGAARTSAQNDALAALRHPQTVTAVQQGEKIVAVIPRQLTSTGQSASTAGGSSPQLSSSPSPATTSTATHTTASTTTTTAASTDVGLPRVGHVFLISLSTAPRSAIFSRASTAPYLRSLLTRGTLLSAYGSLGHGELADELALLSGQAPNRDTTAGCPRYSAFSSSVAPDAKGLVAGNGCVYPDTVLSLADQVTNAGHQWGAYVTGMGAQPCTTPQTGAAEDAGIAGAQADYDILHNPFIFFPSLTSSGECYQAEGDTTQLPTVLAGKPSAVPALTWIAPDACADGAEPDTPEDASSTSTSTSTSTTQLTATTSTATTTTTGLTSTTTATAARDDVCPAGAASGTAAEDGFLAATVPKILASRAYGKNGVLIIAFSGAGAGQGDRPYGTGALVISRWTPRGRRVARSYGPYSLLHSVEDMLDLQPLGHAGTAPAFARQILIR